MRYERGNQRPNRLCAGTNNEDRQSGVVLIQVWRGCLASVVTDDIGCIGSTEFVGAVTDHVENAILENDLLVMVDDEDAVVKLVGDRNVPVLQLHCIRRKRVRVASLGRICKVLKDDVLVPSHFDYASVPRIRYERVPVRESASERSELNSCAVFPHNAPASRNLDDPVVVLIGNQDVAVGEELGAVGIVERSRT